MLKTYCAECGSPTEYSISKPKFCSSCGKSFFNNISTQSKLIQKSNPVKTKIVAEEDYEDDDIEVNDVRELPDIQDLDFDVTINPSNSEKIGDIAGTSKQNDLRQREDYVNPDINENFLENFAKEAGAIRPKTRVRRPKNGK
jgi:hypothetical protein